MKMHIYGHPILRMKAKKIESITPELRAFITELQEFMVEQHGQGIAAPQVGHSIALFIFCYPIYDDNGKYLHHSAPRTVINPVLSNPSAETWIEDEGCLSVPGVRGDVERPISITLSGMNEEGVPFTEELSGWPAKVAMHENDHLNGVLFVDRLSAKDKKAIEPSLRKLKHK